MNLRLFLTEEEGRIPYAYPDSRGLLTIGVGHLIDKKAGGKLPENIIDALLNDDIATATNYAKTVAGFSNLNEVQRAAIVAMIFQMGPEPFDGDGYRDFKNMLTALAHGNARLAAHHARLSLWFNQTPRRAERTCRMLESGMWVPYNLGKS